MDNEYFKVVFTKDNIKKKKKNFEDGFVQINNKLKQLELFNELGKSVAKSKPNSLIIEDADRGVDYAYIGCLYVEFDYKISEKDFLSGKCFTNGGIPLISFGNCLDDNFKNKGKEIVKPKNEKSENCLINNNNAQNVILKQQKLNASMEKVLFGCFENEIKHNSSKDKKASNFEFCEKTIPGNENQETIHIQKSEKSSEILDTNACVENKSFKKHILDQNLSVSSYDKNASKVVLNKDNIDDKKVTQSQIELPENFMNQCVPAKFQQKRKETMLDLIDKCRNIKNQNNQLKMHSNNSHTNGLANFQTQNLSLKTNQSSILPTTIHHPMSRFDFDYKNCALEDKSNQLHDPHKKSTQQNINKKLNKNLERQFLQNASLTENPLKVFSKKQPPKEENKPTFYLNEINIKKEITNRCFIESAIFIKLKEHQKIGIQFLFDSVTGIRDPTTFGCILADSMGLGKTLQVICLILILVKQNPFSEKKKSKFLSFSNKPKRTDPQLYDDYSSKKIESKSKIKNEEMNFKMVKNCDEIQKEKLNNIPKSTSFNPNNLFSPILKPSHKPIQKSSKKIVHNLLTKFDGLLMKVCIVTPLTLVRNWNREFTKWASNLGVSPVVIENNGDAKEISDKVKSFLKDQKKVMICSYETLLLVATFLKNEIGLLVCDEAHRLKNINSKIYSVLNSFKTKRRIFITGTPIQNCLEELFACLNFVSPNFFQNEDKFMKVYIQPISKGLMKSSSEYEKLIANERANHLIEITRPLVMRRGEEVLFLVKWNFGLFLS